ncbi:MAG TPA: BamA/TamA family outer membrane protein [Gemmatimonadaceae bacterium]|nr:BamA/TamA family outer membrane protein [Gemmatimonadaceae bacterium]
MAFLLVLLAAPSRSFAQTNGCEGSAPEVAKVSFEGNKSVPSTTLEATVETAASSGARRFTRFFGTRRCLAQGALLRDVARLMLFYRRKGYPRATVDTVVGRATAPGAVFVRFRIRENEPMLVDSIEIRGVADSAIRARIRRGIKLQPGDPLDRFSLDASAAAIVAGLRRAGYLAGSARAGEQADSARRHAVAWIDVKMGTRRRVGEVHVDARGLDSTEPRISPERVARLTHLTPGAVLGTQELAEARQNLDAVGLFDDIRITLDSTRSADADGTTNVNVAVVEGTSNELRTKFGYGTLDCFRTQIQASRAAVLGKPGRFEATVNLSKVAVGAPLDFAPGICSGDVQADPYSQRLNYYVGGTYAIPALGRRRWAKAVSLYTERRSEFLAYLKTTYLGGSASLTRKYGRHWSGALAYDLSYARTEAEPAVLCATFSACLAADRAQFTESLPFGLASILTTFDNTDVPLDPTRGKSLRLELRIAPQWLGTAVRQQVAGVRLNAAAYYPLAERTVLAVRAQGGVVTTLPGASFIPQGERLFAGGANTVRGFRQNEIGPRVYLADSLRVVVLRDTLLWTFPPDSTGWRAVPTGGTAAAVANVELRVRPKVLTEFIQFVAFIDAGNVWSQGEDNVNNTPIFVTPGVGVRLSTPVGPIRLDLAYNSYAPAHGPAYRDVSLGYATAPLYCVSIGNRLPVTGVGQTDAEGKLIPPVQAEGPCPSTFRPDRPEGFFNRLTLTFSIGQAF